MCILRLLADSYHKQRMTYPAEADAWRAFDTLVSSKVIAIGPDGPISFNALQHSQTRAHRQFYVSDALVRRRRGVQDCSWRSRPELFTDALGQGRVSGAALYCKPADVAGAAKELYLIPPPKFPLCVGAKRTDFGQQDGKSAKMNAGNATHNLRADPLNA